MKAVVEGTLGVQAAGRELLSCVKTVAKEENTEPECAIFTLLAESEFVPRTPEACRLFFLERIDFVLASECTGKLQLFLTRLSYSSFRKAIKRGLLRQYLERRSAFCLRSADAQALRRLSPHEIPAYLSSHEASLVKRALNEAQLKQGFLKSCFQEYRSTWLRSRFMQALPRVLIWLGLLAAFGLAAWLWTRNLGDMAPFEGIRSWGKFLGSLFE